jgi:hypothetical protein
MNEGILEAEWSMLSQALQLDLLLLMLCGTCMVLEESEPFYLYSIKMAFCFPHITICFFYRVGPLGNASLTGRNVLASGGSYRSEEQMIHVIRDACKKTNSILFTCTCTSKIQELITHVLAVKNS